MVAETTWPEADDSGSAATPGYAADLQLAARICEFLNGLLANDRPAIAAMIANRVPCSRALADHPTVQVSVQHGGFHVGLLGLLNGLCGIHGDGNGPICAVFDHEDGDDVRHLLNLERFKLMHDGAA